eukprot:3643812-Amphidinium_carterae.1
MEQLREAIQSHRDYVEILYVAEQLLAFSPQLCASQDASPRCKIRKEVLHRSDFICNSFDDTPLRLYYDTDEYPAPALVQMEAWKLDNTSMNGTYVNRSCVSSGCPSMTLRGNPHRA